VRLVTAEGRSSRGYSRHPTAATERRTRDRSLTSWGGGVDRGAREVLDRGSVGVSG
jgi:hypothetical protein